MYAAGAGVPINKIEAARLYNKAADGGLPQAGARPTEKYLRYIERDGVTREGARGQLYRSEEHTSELQSLMRTSYAVFCLKKKTKIKTPCIQQNKSVYTDY